jgi:outer membrane autotransporter protein
LTINDPTIDPRLSQIYSHLLAWNPAPTGGLMSDVVNPLSVSDPKDMGKEMRAPSSSPDPDRWNVFVQGNVILGQDISSANLNHENSTTSAFMVGADYEFSKNFLMGAFFNYGHSDATLDANGSSATVDTYSPGIYASYAKDGWYGNGVASYGHNAYTEQRNINIGGTFIESPYGAPEGDQEMVDTDGGYDFHNNEWTYGPTVGFQYVHLNVNSFTESGGCSSNLAVDSQAADSFRSRLGGHVSYTAKSCGLLLTPFLDASWQHEFLDDQREINSSFSDIGLGQFTVYTPSPGREAALLATGVNIDIDGMTTVFVNYQAQVAPNYYFGQSILAGVKVAF